MMGWMWGYGPGYGNGLYEGNLWWVGLIWMVIQLLFWGALIVIGIKMFRKYTSQQDERSYSQSHNALEILRARYAKGEIDTEEYKRKQRDLLE